MNIDIANNNTDRSQLSNPESEIETLKDNQQNINSHLKVSRDANLPYSGSGKVSNRSIDNSGQNSGKNSSRNSFNIQND